ncbi:MAG: hypothetical protein L6Q60_15010 [Rhodocyclaceae bacterium]|nr:hypothetical protein [Rhodocyclaceae bacterium]
MKTARALLAASLLLAMGAPAYADAPLGRLFLTPEKRELLDRQRALNALETQVANEDPTILVNGQVLRSSGKRTTWINGQTQNEQETRTGVIAHPDRTASRVTLESSEDPRASVKVGESLNRGTQETLSPLGDGSITIHRRPASPPR